MTWGRYRICLDHSKPMVVIDLETTGLRASKHAITEIAALRLIPGQADAPFYHRLVTQERRLSRRIVELTGLTDEMLADKGVPAREAFEGLLDFIGGDPIVSYNAPFDLGFLNAACAKLELVVRRRGHSCALSLARRVFVGMPNYRLHTVASMLCLDMSEQHRALSDALRAAQVYRIASQHHLDRTARPSEDPW